MRDLGRFSRLTKLFRGLIGGVVPCCWAASSMSSIELGWGVDACLTTHVSDSNRPAYLRLLRDSGVTILRERGPNPQMALLHDAGYSISAFVELPGIHSQQSGDSLPEDLLAVYFAAQRMAQEHSTYVDVWEIGSEPDIGYCRDLPDRYVAFEKAVYLGIKSAGAQSGRLPIALMGALALPPGPWLDRAIQNGILNYTDAYNFHFYGLAPDLSGTIRAHQLATRTANGGKDLPLWITECGFDPIDPDAWDDPSRRASQAASLEAAARIALAAPDVAVFMPFILVHQDDAYALTISPSKPWPAWTAYAQFTQTHPWPRRPATRSESKPIATVLQWMPDNTTTDAHKVSGSYRFQGSNPIRGELRLYNLSGQVVTGHLAFSGETQRHGGKQ